MPKPIKSFILISILKNLLNEWSFVKAVILHLSEIITSSKQNVYFQRCNGSSSLMTEYQFSKYDNFTIKIPVTKLGIKKNILLGLRLHWTVFER